MQILLRRRRNARARTSVRTKLLCSSQTRPLPTHRYLRCVQLLGAPCPFARLSSGGGRPVAAPAPLPVPRVGVRRCCLRAAELARHELLPARAIVRRERATGQPLGQQVRCCRVWHRSPCPRRGARRGGARCARADALCPAAPPSSASPSARTPWRATCSSSRRQSKQNFSPRAARLLPSCARRSPRRSRRAQEGSDGFV